MQPSRRVVERQAYKQTGQTRRLNRPPPNAASYSLFTLPWDETIHHCYIIDPLWPAHTGTSTGGHACQSPSPPTSETGLSQEIHSEAESVGEEGGERHVVNNRCETTCTSRHRPPLDNAATRRRWGRGENTASCPADNLQSHQPPSRPIGQARPPLMTEDGRPRSVNWSEGFKLNYQQYKQPLSFTAASAHIPISRIDNRDMKTRICFDNHFFYYRLTCLETTERTIQALVNSIWYDTDPIRYRSDYRPCSKQNLK